MTKTDEHGRLMNDATTSEKAAQLLEDINLLFSDVAGHPRVEQKLAKIRSTAIDLQGRILHLEQKNDAESEGLQQLCSRCRDLKRDLALERKTVHHLRALNAELQSLINAPEGRP